MPTEFLELRSKAAGATILLAHGAGAPMVSPGMTSLAEALAEQDLKVVRFEFSYMADRRTEGPRPPPPRADKIDPRVPSCNSGTRWAGPAYHRQHVDARADRQ